MATISFPFVSGPGFSATIAYDSVTLAILRVRVVNNSGSPVTIVLKRPVGDVVMVSVPSGPPRTVDVSAYGFAYTEGMSRVGLMVKSMPIGMELGTR